MAFVLAVAPAGQSRGRGGVTGSVVFDGGRLPGVTVSIANSGVTRTVITNDAGRFDVPDLPDGAYTLTAQLPGFQLYRIADAGYGFRSSDLQRSAARREDSLQGDRRGGGSQLLRPGALLARAQADELLFNEARNEVVVVKYLN